MDTCTAVRESISARADGEEPLLDVSACDTHIAGCAECRAFATGLAPLLRASRLRTAEAVPDLTGAILTAAAEDRVARGAARQDQVRGVLALVGVAQAVVAIVSLLTDGGLHLGRELAAWELALGVGFVVAALQPSRATGMVPMVAVLSLTVIVGAIGDLAAGTTTLLAEAGHLVEVVGVLLVVAVSRAAGDEPLRLRTVWR